MSTDNNNMHEESIDQLAPKLSAMRQPWGDQHAPEGYFNTFPDKIINRVKSVEGQTVRRIPMSKVNLRLAVAASLVFYIGFALSIYVAQKRISSINVVNSLDSSHDLYLDEVDLEHVIEVASELENTGTLEIGIEQYVDEYHLLEEL
jgi:hypothetical protein